LPTSPTPGTTDNRERGGALDSERRHVSNQIDDKRGCNVSAERIKRWPTKELPRERLLAEGPGRLTDADLLAIILRIGSGTFQEGVPGTNAYEAALSILRNFRGLRGLDRARIHDLLKFPGLGPAKVAHIKAAFELGKRVCAGKLTASAFESSLAVANHYRPRFTGKRNDGIQRLFEPNKATLKQRPTHRTCGPVLPAPLSFR